MTIKVRQRKAKDGQIRLFLDIYNPNASKKRTNKSLDLYLYEKPVTPAQKKSNKENLDAAEKIRAKYTLEFAMDQNGLSELNGNTKTSIDFLDYFKKLTDKRFDSTNNYGNWDSTYKHLKKYCPNGILISDVDTNWLNDFKHYLKYIARKKSNEPLSQSSLHSYFNKVKACLNQAHKDELITKNPGNNVKGFKEAEVQREFLSFEELKELAVTECSMPQLKSAFLFSCLTGIRWSDIVQLSWADLHYSEKSAYWYVRFKQKKTKGAETLPISNQARQLLGENPEPTEIFEKIFKGLKYSAWHNLKLQQWIMKAGITKQITFHCARHTFATLQLTNGTDICTLSKLLGHRELKTTQVYGKIIDEKKIQATNAIPDLEL